MLKFEINKEKTDANFEVSECFIGDDCRFTLIKDKKSGLMSVFVRRDVYWDNHDRLGYIEIWDHSPTNVSEAKRIASKLYDIVLGYKWVTPWKE